MRLFFSYGHDENEPIVQMLHQDLIAQGFEVWIDRYEIKGGDDWRRKIAEDILGCDMTSPLPANIRYAVLAYVWTN